MCNRFVLLEPYLGQIFMQIFDIAHISPALPSAFINGHTPYESTWERWRNVRVIKDLHEYLTKIGLQQHKPIARHHSN